MRLNHYNNVEELISNEYDGSLILTRFLSNGKTGKTLKVILAFTLKMLVTFQIGLQCTFQISSLSNSLLNKAFFYIA